MQNITITCAVLILIAFVSFYSQGVIESHQKITRASVKEEVFPTLTETLRSGSLSGKRSEREIIRFSLYRSFDDPIWITLSFDDNKMIIESRKFDVGRQSKKKIDLIVEVDPEFVQDVKDEILNSYLVSQKEEGEIGLDGSTWIIELNWNGQYYASDVWSPDFGPEHQLGRLLFERAARYASLGTLY